MYHIRSLGNKSLAGFSDEDFGAIRVAIGIGKYSDFERWECARVWAKKSMILPKNIAKAKVRIYGWFLIALCA